jgi:hypothetical protein
MTFQRTAVCLFAAAGLLLAGSASADHAGAPSALCGDHEKKKDVKKPEEKKPNPASAEGLCGDHEKKKDVKKPDKDKKGPNPACGGDCDCDCGKKKKGDDKKGDKNPV